MTSPVLAALRPAAVPLLFGSRRSLHLLERNLMVYRRSWQIIVSGFFEPVFYLVSIRVGIGKLVGGVLHSGRPVTYAAFAAPALLASSAMNGAVFESTMNVFFKLKMAKTYDAVLATPVGIGDIVLGEIAWCVIRGQLYATGFFVVMLTFGLLESWWAVLLMPATALIALAFASVGMAATSYMRSWQDFELIQLFVLPMFLLSATFFPLATYPGALQLVVRITPLYQGADMLRALSLGTVDWSEAGHAAYLLCMALVGLTLASRRLEKLLLG